jgi:zinc D-Ala-D-Ala carboxypeptidase
MVKSHPKNENLRISDIFYSREFDCQCHYPDCTTTLIDDLLLEGLEQLWKLTGGFIIDSGYRCQKHNFDIGGAKNSEHVLGKAADCKSLKSYNGNLMARYAEEVKIFKWGGIGIYSTFVHCDTGPMRRWALPTVC